MLKFPTLEKQVPTKDLFHENNFLVNSFTYPIIRKVMLTKKSD